MTWFQPKAALLQSMLSLPQGLPWKPLVEQGWLLGMKEWESAPSLVAYSWPHSSLGFRYNGGGESTYFRTGILWSGSNRSVMIIFHHQLILSDFRKSLDNVWNPGQYSVSAVTCICCPVDMVE